MKQLNMPAVMDMPTSLFLYMAFLLATAGDMIPCGDITVNDETSICCEERVYIRHGLEPACCGMQAYDASTHICCIEYVWPKMGENPTCCGNQLYDNKLHDCSPDGQLTMKIDQNVGNKGGEHPLLMKPVDATLPPDDNYYIDKDYEIDQSEFPDFFNTHSSGTEGGEGEVPFRPIVYKTRPSTTTTDALTDLPQNFWEEFQRNIDKKKYEHTDILKISTRFSPRTIADSFLTTTTKNKLVPVETNPEETQTFISSTVRHDVSSSKESQNIVTDNPIRKEILDNEDTFSATAKYTLFTDDTGTRPTYPTLLPAERHPPQRYREACCHTSGLHLYQCCLRTLNNSVNTILPPCCSGFVVKVCCWTGENDYSCCSRQEACCHPEKLYHNLKNKRPNDWLEYRTKLDKDATFVPVIRPQKTEIKEIRRRSRKCCWSSRRPSCCAMFKKRVSCCSDHGQGTPPSVTPPWQLRVRTTVRTTTPPTTTAPSRGIHSSSRYRCCAASVRPTCCSTVSIRPHCCFREQTKKISSAGRNWKSRSQLSENQQNRTQLLERNCSCWGGNCCNSRRWQKRCCRVSASLNAVQRPQRPQAEQPDNNGASCCNSGDPSTCCWVLYIQISRMPACCKNHLSFRNNKQPKPLCSQTAYNPVTEMCCQGQKQAKKGVRPRCCGQTGYDAYLYHCCKDRISRTC